MSSLLYYSISSDLTKDEIILINKQVKKNREELLLNAKRKTKRLFGYGMFIFQVGQPLVPCAVGVMIPPPARSIDRLSPIEQDIMLTNKNYSPQIGSIIESKMDKMVQSRWKKQFYNYVVVTD